MNDMLSKFLHIPWVIIILLTCSCETVCDYTDDVLSYVPGMDYFSDDNLTTIKIESDKCTNQGGPFYVLIKATDFPTYVTEDYEKIANTVISGKPQGDCFEAICVIPGKKLSLNWIHLI